MTQIAKAETDDAEFRRWYRASKLYRRFWVPHGIDQLSIARALYRFRRFAAGTLLDIGCGPKKFQPIYNGLVSAYWGVDLHSAELHALHKIDVYGDAVRLPIASESMTTVLSVQMLGYIEDPNAALHEMARVLEPGGRLILTHSQHGEATGPSDLFRFTEWFYRAALPKHGLEIEVLEARTGSFGAIGEDLATTVYYRKDGKRSRLRVFLSFVIQECFTILDNAFFQPHGGIGHIVIARKTGRRGGVDNVTESSLQRRSPGLYSNLFKESPNT